MRKAWQKVDVIKLKQKLLKATHFSSAILLKSYPSHLWLDQWCDMLTLVQYSQSQAEMHIYRSVQAN